MGLDPSAHLAARSAFNRAEWRAVFSLRRAFGEAARNSQDRSLQTCRKFAIILLDLSTNKSHPFGWLFSYLRIYS